MAVIAVRHVTASGRLDECWSLYAPDARIEALVRMGGVVVPLALYVCSAERPRAGAYRIARIDSESWRVLPELYVTIMMMGRPRLLAVPRAIQELAMGDQMHLANTPADVSEALELL